MSQPQARINSLSKTPPKCKTTIPIVLRENQELANTTLRQMPTDCSQYQLCVISTLGLLLMRYQQGQHREEMKQYLAQVTDLVTGSPREGRSVRVLVSLTDLCAPTRRK